MSCTCTEDRKKIVVLVNTNICIARYHKDQTFYQLPKLAFVEKFNVSKGIEEAPLYNRNLSFEKFESSIAFYITNHDGCAEARTVYTFIC